MIRNREKGNAIIEFGLIAPLLFPILLAIFDFGMYAYSFISVQNAARAAAIRNSGGVESATDTASACAMAIEELRGLPNIGSSFSSSCNAAPLVVSSVLCDGSSACSRFSGTPDGAQAVAVTVTYTVPPLFRIPLAGPLTVTSASQMKFRSVQ